MVAKNPPTREELLRRWRSIEETDDEIDSSSSNSSQQDRLIRLKEDWFLDAFKFLNCLPSEKHIWCGYWDLMGPLVETFYNFFKDERGDTPLKLLWTRISEEMRHCTRCICQHHRAQEMYYAEYEWSTVGPLLGVLQCLDEERVTHHLTEINNRIVSGNYVPLCDDAEVVSVMFEAFLAGFEPNQEVHDIEEHALSHEKGT